MSRSAALSPLSAADFRALYAEVAATARAAEDVQGDGVDRGALRHLTAERIAAAARTVHSGVTVALGLPLSTQASGSMPSPADHHMTLMPEPDAGGLAFAKDYIGVDFHNDGVSHIDAFSHVVFDGSLHGGLPDECITAAGASSGSIELVRDGLVGRGVLLDIAALRGVDWLEPGDQIGPDELAAAERRQAVRVGPGDILLVRTGHARLVAEQPDRDTTEAKAGLHPTAVRFLAERRVAALGCDTNSDAAPGTTEGIAFPVHVLAVHAMGVYLLDYLQFEDLRRVCAELGRSDFLLVVAPLRIVGGTGSPVNPIAIL